MFKTESAGKIRRSELRILFEFPLRVLCQSECVGARLCQSVALSRVSDMRQRTPILFVVDSSFKRRPRKVCDQLNQKKKIRAGVPIDRCLDRSFCHLVYMSPFLVVFSVTSSQFALPER